MIVLLSYSMSLSANNNAISSTGVLERRISIGLDTIKLINSKLVELNYQKDINDKLNDIIKNQDEIIKQDSIAINSLYNSNESCVNVKEKYRTQRNVSFGVNIGLVLLLLTIIF